MGIGAYGIFSYQNILAEENTSENILATMPNLLSGELDDFLSTNQNLKTVAQRRVLALSDRELAGMVLMPAYESFHTYDDLVRWINDYHVGGFMILRKDYTTNDADLVQSLESELPLLISIDAEPSLVQYRLPQLGGIPNTNSLNTIDESNEIAETISRYLHTIGVNINFAPVYDGNQNQSVIGNRSYGNEPNYIHTLAGAFSSRSLELGIVPTAKHFPGHGNVSGDTHKNLQTINGELVELEQFRLAINDDIPMVMVGHLAIENNPDWSTNGLPASLSKNIMTDLLQEELGFKGLVVTDALNMGALDQFDNIPIRALEAGADIVLLPRDIDTAFNDVYTKIQQDEKFKKLLQSKVEKIMKMKLVLKNNK